MTRRITTAYLGVVVMAVLAYVPALLSSPGRMPADTKLYLYLDPRRLVSDSIWTFDARQFAGWVPHQLIAYAWPSGPWYVAVQALGLPDWVAHRLWVGTIMFAAGTGVAWAARRLGLSVVAAIAAGLLYQLSPYLVPYVSRTSSMLLPWAGLGWIVALTIGAATRTRWRDAALCALVIGTVGAVNTTALLLIAPAPVLWLAVAAAERTITPREAATTAARIGGLALGTSAWWLAMQVIQDRHGADLLAYSESLEDVSLTSTSVEVWRSLGYWLTYVRDAYAPTTTAGADYVNDLLPIVCGFLLVVVALLGLALVRFPARRFAVAMTFAGLVLGVGVHPFDDPSPIARLFRGDGQEGLSLALRSSTRALPLLAAGLALGTAALVDAVARAVAWRRVVLAGAVVVMALGNLPVLTDRGLVDPALERDEQAPSAWADAAAALDELAPGARVLQLPGAEFGAFTWGYTVDPPLPALTERPVVTRDLLPLGAPAAMDLLDAFDDRFQVGSAELAAVAPMARLFGADTIWLPGDAAFDRFRTPRPELTAELFASGGDGLGDPTSYGEPVVNASQVPMVDEESLTEPAVGRPVAPVTLVPVVDPVPVVRASDSVVVLSGSGDGLVDAAAAGLIAGDEAIRYSASMTAPEVAEAVAGADLVVVTDSNRRRAHHWRGSQDVTGYTEPTTGPQTAWEDSGDARLDVFPDAGASSFTGSRQVGPMSATATSYGERFSYLPEARPAMAIDGDPNTAWTVLDPTAQYLEITTDAGVDHVTVLQPNGLRDVRKLQTITVTVDGGDPQRVVLDDRSLITGQRIPIPATAGPTTVRLALGRVVEAEAQRGNGRPDRTPVGFAEIDAGLDPSPEWIVVPSDLTTAMRDAGIERPVTFVLTRERVRATNRWRADPEWRLMRMLDVPFTAEFDVDTTVRLDLRAPDAVLAELLGITGPTATARLAGVAAAGGWAAADGDAETAWITPFNEVVGSTLRAELVDPAAPMTVRQRLGNYSLVTAVRLTQGDGVVDVVVPPPDDDGASTIAVPDRFREGPLTIEIAAVAERTTRDRRFGDPVVMPAAISEVGNVVASSMPPRFDTGCRDDLVTIDEVAVPVRVTGSIASAFDGAALGSATCSGPVTLPAGPVGVTGQQRRRSGLQVDRIVLAPQDDPPPNGSAATRSTNPVATVVDSSRLGRTITVEQCANGCWLIVGEGHHPSWEAMTAAGSLGPSQLLAGGFNGWWIPPHEGPLMVWVGWTAQRPLNAAIAVSVAAAFVALTLAVVDRARRRPLERRALPQWATLQSDGLRRSLVAGAAWVILAGLLVDPGWAWWGLAGGAAVVATRRIRLAGLVAVAAIVRIAVDVVTTVRTDHPPATPGFPLLFEDLHHLGLFAAVSVAISALARWRPAESSEC
jgi:arabinofuranan 3-O-arabinosyltransferase